MFTVYRGGRIAYSGNLFTGISADLLAFLLLDQ